LPQVYCSRFLIPTASVELRRVTVDGDTLWVPLSSSADDIGLQIDSTVYMWAVLQAGNCK
jgi:hypothetical protein